MLLSKTHLKYILPLLFIFFGAVDGMAQKKKSNPKSKDFFKPKSPKIQYVKPDTTVLIEHQDFPDKNSDANKSVPFNPAKKLSIVSEDTSTLNLG